MLSAGNQLVGEPSGLLPSTLRTQICWTAFTSTLLCWLTCVATGRCAAQTSDVLCVQGNGSFAASFQTGVSVKVRAAKAGALSTRACEATLDWNQGSLLVATNASQIDLDVFGVDLGLGGPVSGFQVKQSENGCCAEYQVYSMVKPPQLLRTITGGDSFGAADTDLDGRIEIWTHDSPAVDGFENFRLGEIDFLPTLVLRFEHGKLLDVGSEFQAYFDHEISGIRKDLTSEGLRDFKGSDGRLSTKDPSLAERTHRLRKVKARVLEIVWGYLYSGREQAAWRELSEMWPAADVDRIRGAILNARASGITAQVQGVSDPGSRIRGKRSQVFDAIEESPTTGKLGIVPPRPIMLRRPPPEQATDIGAMNSEVLLELVIDSAGKVRSAETAGKSDAAGSILVRAAAGWRFIPAFKSGRPVASRTRLLISPKQ